MDLATSIADIRVPRSPAGFKAPTSGLHWRLSCSSGLSLLSVLGSLMPGLCPKAAGTLRAPLALITGLPLWSTPPVCIYVRVIDKATFLPVVQPFTNHPPESGKATTTDPTDQTSIRGFICQLPLICVIITTGVLY